MGRYIPQKSLENLRKYNYKGVDKSLLSKYVLNPFWNWFVTLWPTTVAPNTITLTGLSLVFFNFLTLLYYDPTYITGKGGEEKLPQWLYFTWGIGLFLYQSLDAIDGKQARRTGMAGPLGEMFDHGCDAINTTLEVILASYALNLGRSWWTVSSQIATLANFYLTTWEEWHTGQLYLGPFSGPVEGIIMIVIIYLISGFYGPAVWDTRVLDFFHLTKYFHKTHTTIFSVPVDLNLPFNELFMVFGAFGLAFNIISSYSNVRAAQHAKKKRTFTPFLRLTPFVLSAVLQVMWLSHPEWSHSAIIESELFVPFLCAWGLQFAHMVGRMIIAHVTSTRFPLWDWMWIWSMIGAADANAQRLFGRAPIIQSTREGAAALVWLTLLVSAVAYGRFVTLVIQDITEYLGIACFKVKKRDEKGEWRDAKDVNKEMEMSKAK